MEKNLTTWIPKVCEITALRAIFRGFGAIILHTFGVQVVAGVVVPSFNKSLLRCDSKPHDRTPDFRFKRREVRLLPGPSINMRTPPKQEAGVGGALAHHKWPL